MLSTPPLGRERGGTGERVWRGDGDVDWVGIPSPCLSPVEMTLCWSSPLSFLPPSLHLPPLLYLYLSQILSRILFTLPPSPSPSPSPFLPLSLSLPFLPP